MGTDRYRRILDRLKLRHLRLIDAIADARSVSAAAERLNVTQPAVSKGLREIEDILGMPLFVRGTRGLTPTMIGRSLLAHGKIIQSEVRHITEELDAADTGSSGVVVVGSMLVSLPNLLPAAVHLLRERNVDVSVRVIEGAQYALAEGLRSGAIDLMVGRLAPIDKRELLEQEVLFQEPIAVVAGRRHPFMQQPELSHRELAHARWILPPPDSVVYGPVLQLFAQHGLSNPRAYVETTSYMLVRSLLIEHDAVAALPLSVVQRDLDNGDIAILPVRFPHEPLSVGIITVSGRTLSPGATQLVFCIRQAASNHRLGSPKPGADRHPPAPMTAPGKKRQRR